MFSRSRERSWNSRLSRNISQREPQCLVASKVNSKNSSPILASQPTSDQDIIGMLTRKISSHTCLTYLHLLSQSFRDSNHGLDQDFSHTPVKNIVRNASPLRIITLEANAAQLAVHCLTVKHSDGVHVRNSGRKRLAKCYRAGFLVTAMDWSRQLHSPGNQIHCSLK